MRKILSRMGAAVRGFGFKQWFMTALIAALLLASAASLIGLGVVRRALVSVTAAERFRGGTDVRFAQIGCFLPVGQGKTEEDIFKFRQTLDSKLVEQSLEAPENGSLYLDAYCGMGTVTAVGNNGVSAERVRGRQTDRVRGGIFYQDNFTETGCKKRQNEPENEKNQKI